jgi:hypothetical protein
VTESPRSRQEHFTDDEVSFVSDCFNKSIKPRVVAQQLKCSERTIQVRYRFLRSGVKRKTRPRWAFMTPEREYFLEEKVAKALREECLLIFGSSWNIDNAHRLARTAIEVMKRHQLA